MRILSFDTSSPNLYACLADGNNIVSEKILICNPQDRQFSASLIMPTIESLLANANWQKQDLEMIVVGTGPGSFTGIRVAVVTARTLCQALNLPLLGINRFQCYAFKEQIRDLTAMVLTAGKKQYFCADLNGEIFALSGELPTPEPKANSGWQMTTHHFSEDELLIYLRNFEHVYVEKSAATLVETRPEAAKISWKLLPDLNNSAVTQAEIACNHLSSCVASDFPYHKIRPLYIQKASVTVKSKQLSG